MTLTTNFLATLTAPLGCAVSLIVYVPVLVHEIKLNAVIWSFTMVNKNCGFTVLTPFVTWVFSLCRPAGFATRFDNAKKSFYQAFNAVFGKVGRVASQTQTVVIEVLISKCVPSLYYGSECCPISKSQFKSLEFALCGFCNENV